MWVEGLSLNFLVQCREHRRVPGVRLPVRGAVDICA